MAYISIVATTTTSITVQMAGLDTNYQYSDRTCVWYLDGIRKGSVSLGAKISSGGRYSFTSLESGTSFSIKASISSPNMDTKTFTATAYTDEPEIQVSEWTWDSSNGSASSAETRASYNALFNNGLVSDFSYRVWNDMCDKVYEVIQAAGTYWYTTYGTLSSTKMSSNDRALTAARFNALRQNIGGRVSTGISEVSRGDIVYGWYFTTLARCLNEWIRLL